MTRNKPVRSICLCALVLGLASVANRLHAEWNLWPSPNDNTEVLDQQQTLHETPIWSSDPASIDGVGQQFVPTNASLYRIDFRSEEQLDRRPATFNLWSWNTDRTTTVAQTPLFTDTLSMTGGVYERQFTVYPRITVTPGHMYYFEVDVSGRDGVTVWGTQATTDAYPAGKAWFYGRFPDDDVGQTQHFDLWFKTYGSPQGTATPPTLVPSNSSLSWYNPDTPCSVLTPGCPGYGASCPASSDSFHAGNAYSKCDYYKRFKDYIDYVGCYEKSCGSGLGQEPFLKAAQYKDSCTRGSCDESLAIDAIAMLRERYDYQFCATTNTACQASECACDSTSDTFWFEYVGMAYNFLQNSPSLQDVDKRRIRCVMVDSGKKFWPSREAGAGNRPLAGALTYLLATNAWAPFSNDDQCPSINFTQIDHDNWVNYAQNNWNMFWAARNFGSDSSNYIDNVALRLVTEYAYFAGLDATVWSDAGFHDLVEDLYKQLSPMGVDANFGENAGVADLQTALIWFFEKAAKKFGDPKYKWLAHQIYKYNETRVCDSPGPPNYNDSFVNQIGDIAWAYLEADDSLSDAAPPAQSEVLKANQSSASGVSWNNNNVGQTFKPTATPLARLDLWLKANTSNTSAGTIKLWKWNTNYATTVAQTPLYQDTVNMSTINVALTFYPFLDVDTTATYFVEVSRASKKFALGGSPQTAPPVDLYTDGVLYNQGVASGSADLWFKTWSLTPDGSTYTTRLAVSMRPLSQRTVSCPTAQETCSQMFDFGTATVPDKLILRSGYDPNNLHALFTLTIADYDHGDWNPAALSMMTDENSVLLAESPFPYWFVRPRSTIDQSLGEVSRHWGGTYGTWPSSVTVTRFSDTRKATVAWLDWNDIHGWGVAQQRRLLFVKDRFLWIRDRFTFPAAMTATIGTVWHAGDIHPTYGTNWYDLYYRQPLGNVYEQKNPERYVSLYFIKRGTDAVAAWHEPTYDAPPECASAPVQPTPACETIDANCRSSPPFVIYDKWAGSVAANDKRYMDAILYPHGAPGGAVPPISTPLYDDTRNVAIQITTNGETWTLVDNPDGITINVSGLTTDAKYLITRTKTGVPVYVLTYDATQVVVSPSINMTWPVRTSVEIGGY